MMTTSTLGCTVPDIGRLVNPPQPEDRGGISANRLREATIVSDPADTTEEVWVTIDGDDPPLRTGPCPWTPRIVDSETYGIPSSGDRALLAVSEDNEAWVVSWWPA